MSDLSVMYLLYLIILWYDKEHAWPSFEKIFTEGYITGLLVNQLNYNQCILLLEMLFYFEIDIDTRPETQALIELWGKLQQEGQKDSLRIQWN